MEFHGILIIIITMTLTDIYYNIIYIYAAKYVIVGSSRERESDKKIAKNIFKIWGDEYDA